jgi:hypothetical protein
MSKHPPPPFLPGQVAQLVERPPEKRKVGGSRPPLTTSTLSGFRRGIFSSHARYAAGLRRYAPPAASYARSRPPSGLSPAVSCLLIAGLARLAPGVPGYRRVCGPEPSAGKTSLR